MYDALDYDLYINKLAAGDMVFWYYDGDLVEVSIVADITKEDNGNEHVLKELSVHHDTCPPEVELSRTTFRPTMGTIWQCWQLAHFPYDGEKTHVS